MTIIKLYSGYEVMLNGHTFQVETLEELGIEAMEGNMVLDSSLGWMSLDEFEQIELELSAILCAS